MNLAGTPGPHVFVSSLVDPVIDEDDLDHLSKSLRMRAGDALTLSDGAGAWCRASFSPDGRPVIDGGVQVIESPRDKTTVAFSLVKGSKPELVIQKLTELGIDHIVVLAAERSVVKWDEPKADRAKGRWERIIREASMQSHRVQLPELVGVLPAIDWIADNQVAIAHFGGEPIGSDHHSVAVGPEGGWSPNEVDAASHRVSLGDTVLRAETAAIAAGTLLRAASR